MLQSTVRQKSDQLYLSGLAKTGYTRSLNVSGDFEQKYTVALLGPLGDGCAFGNVDRGPDAKRSFVD